MSRPISHALLATLASTGCYHGGVESVDATPTTPTTHEPDDAGDDEPDDAGGGELDDAGGDDHDSTSDIALTVVDRNNKPIVGARVHHGDHVHITDGSKEPMVLTGFRGGREVLQVEGDTWMASTAVVDLLPGRSMNARVMLLPRDPGDPNTFQPFAVSTGITHEFGAVKVSIPPDAIVDRETREPIAGLVTLSVVPIDPTQDKYATPGPLVYRDPDGKLAPLRTLFMADISVWQGSKELDLGAEATIRFRVPDVIHANHHEPEIPAWYYDDGDGTWKRDGSGTLDADGFWTATVTHLTPWNADVPIEELGCVTARACIDDNDPCTGAPGVPVTAEGLDFMITELTGDDGVACLNVPADAVGTVHLGLPGENLDTAEALPKTKSISCGMPGDCPELTFKQPSICNPGESMPCAYEGPPATLDHGKCAAPLRECIDGIAYDLCDGGYFPLDPDNDVDEGCMLPQFVLNNIKNPAYIAEYDLDCDGMLEPGLGCGCPAADTVIDCYDYPSEYYLNAPDVCTAGTMFCPGGGVAPECVGPVDPEPKVEDPNTIDIDDDCDGSFGNKGDPAVDDHVYFSANDIPCRNQMIYDVVPGLNGTIYISGVFTTEIDLGINCVLTSDNSQQTNMFVARFDANLVCDKAAWAAISDSDMAAVDASHLTRAVNGTIAVLGTCESPSPNIYDESNNPIAALDKCPGDQQVVVVTFFDQDLGVLLGHEILGKDSKSALPSPGSVEAQAIVYSGGSDRFLVTGGFSKATFGMTTFTSKAGQELFVASFEPDGTSDLFHQVGPTIEAPNSYARSTAMAVTDGTIVLTGTFGDGFYLNSNVPIMPGDGSFVATFDQNMNNLNLGRLSKTNDLTPTALAARPDQIYVAGHFNENVTIADVFQLNNTGAEDSFLLPLSPTLDVLQPLQVRGGAASQIVRKLALNAAGEPHIAGDFDTTLQIADQSVMVNNSSKNAFVVKHTVTPNAPLWLWNSDGSGTESVFGMAIDQTTSTVYVVGSANGSSGLGANGACADGFLVKLSL